MITCNGSQPRLRRSPTQSPYLKTLLQAARLPRTERTAADAPDPKPPTGIDCGPGTK